MKNILNNKIIKITLIILSVIFLVYLAFIIPDIYKSYKWQKSVERFQESIEKPFKEDIYGGKTPEETWQMFLSALEKGDIELASKYYDVEHQGEARKWLEELKEKGELAQTIEEMRGLEREVYEDNLSFPDKAFYSYRYYNKRTGKYLWSTTVFYLNPYTKVWKILW